MLNLVLEREELANLAWGSERDVEVYLGIEFVDMGLQSLSESLNPVANVREDHITFKLFWAYHLFCLRLRRVGT